MIRIFIGFDERQPVAFQVLAHSIYRRSSVPVSITPLVLSTLPIKRRGLTDFTYSRYLVPWLCDYKGSAIFMDADMLCLGDIAEIEQHNDKKSSVLLVKNPKRFEWPSFMLFNNEFCEKLTPEYIEDVRNMPQKFDWANNIGDLPMTWNHIVGYDAPDPGAKLVHYTAGIPCWPETKDCELSVEWNQEAWRSTSTVTWQELMGNSVHVDIVQRGLK